MNTEKHLIVQTATAQMPGSCKFGRYRRVAVLEVPAGMEQAPAIRNYSKPGGYDLG